MDRLSICMLSTDFLPNIGGIAAHVYGISKALAHQGHGVRVLNIRYGIGENKIEEMEEITVHRLFIERKFGKLALLSWLGQGRKYLQSLLTSEKIDILHWHCLFNDSYLAKLVDWDCAKIFTNHSSAYLKMLNSPFKRVYLKWMLKHTDKIIAPSQELSLKSRAIKPAEEIIYIPNGVDTEKFSPNVKAYDIRVLYPIPKNGMILLCPRRLDPKNGIEYLIKSVPYVLREVDNAYFLIAGDGDKAYGKYLEKLSYEKGVSDNVIFAGKVDNVDMPGYYSSCDVVVLPSLVEATSIAGLEGMACGKPIIGTKVGGIPEIVTNEENGLLVEPTDPQNLAQAIITLLKDQDKRKNLGLNGRKLALDKFDWRVIAQRTVEVYTSSIKKNKRHSTSFAV